jgi:hypothetical protein
MRGRPSTVAMHASSPRAVHAGVLMRSATRRACASAPSAEIVHSSCPSRPLTMPAMNRPARDHVNWRRSDTFAVVCALLPSSRAVSGSWSAHNACRVPAVRS